MIVYGTEKGEDHIPWWKRMRGLEHTMLHDVGCEERRDLVFD